MSAIPIPQVLPWIGDAEMEAVSRTISDNWVTEGPQAMEFSRLLNQLIGVEYGVLAPNGTLALVLGLLALDVGPGDEVLVPDTTFIGTANAVQILGATPVFVEVTSDNFQIDIDQAGSLVTPRTRAVMPVHLYGMCCNMDKVMDFAGTYGLSVIEDAAQAIGVLYRQKHAGSIGDVGCFSFFADKTITTGEGGYVVCKDAAVYEKLLLLRNQGRLDRGSFIHPAIGYNFRMTDMQAAMGVAQLDKLKEIIQRKLAIYNWYREHLREVPQVRFLDVEPHSTHVPFRVVLICEDSHGLMSFLDENGIQTRSFFYPLHKQPCFSHLRGKSGQQGADGYPNAQHGYENGICLPVYPTLKREQVDLICVTIRRFFNN